MKVYSSSILPARHSSLLSLFVLLSLNLVFGPNAAIAQQGKKLIATDFKGQPDETVDYLAQTTPVISLKYSAPASCGENGKVRLKIETGVAVSDRSWLKLAKIKSPELLTALLSHEQGHYDMGEIFALELKKTLSGICFDKVNYRQQVDSVFKSLYSRYDSLQKQYDSDTDHMRNKPAQYKWKGKIEDMRKTVQ